MSMILVRRIAAAAIAAVSLAAGASTAPLSAADQAEIARVESYLGAIRSMRSGFMQTSSGGEFAQGQIYLQRPGKLRIAYQPPTPLQVYADGYWLIYVDTELDQATHVPVNSTPAGLLVGADAKLSGEVTVTRIERGPGALRVEIVQTAEPDAGRITLVFGEAPLELRQWKVIDARGIETTVTLRGPEYGVTIDPALFVFNDPRFARPPDR